MCLTIFYLQLQRDLGHKLASAHPTGAQDGVETGLDELATAPSSKEGKRGGGMENCLF